METRRNTVSIVRDEPHNNTNVGRKIPVLKSEIADLRFEIALAEVVIHCRMAQARRD
jgi:hypothetical protein